MKKLILAALLSVVGVAVVTDIMTDVAYAYSCNSCHDRGCSRCHVRSRCAKPMECPVCETVVTCGPKPVQRCAKYIKVSNCCPVIKHVDISYTCGECPTGFELDGDAEMVGEYTTNKIAGEKSAATKSAKPAKYVKSAQ